MTLNRSHGVNAAVVLAGDRRGAVRLDDRNRSRAVRESPKPLELEAVRRLPLREEGEIALDCAATHEQCPAQRISHNGE